MSLSRCLFRSGIRQVSSNKLAREPGIRSIHNDVPAAVAKSPVEEAIEKGAFKIKGENETQFALDSGVPSADEGYEPNQLKDVHLNKMMRQAMQEHTLERKKVDRNPQDMRVSGGVFLELASDKGRCKEQELKQLFQAYNRNPAGLEKVLRSAKQLGLNERQVETALRYTTLPVISSRQLQGRADVVMVARRPDAASEM
ncbi:hypothetical protein CYMTET_18222 [Cymbomonas tetramitiformis]|uniref:Uncharacterized protein n=1 Tax=Cymbomonas tetramitiformis TaxID=36881 RepID=A0AAE0L6E1_9CHLO|nr:hypothetical protein CYMTET_18222 [Cymbomonas tetramitiformis]